MEGEFNKELGSTENEEFKKNKINTPVILLLLISTLVFIGVALFGFGYFNNKNPSSFGLFSFFSEKKQGSSIELSHGEIEEKYGFSIGSVNNLKECISFINITNQKEEEKITEKTIECLGKENEQELLRCSNEKNKYREQKGKELNGIMEQCYEKFGRPKVEDIQVPIGAGYDYEGIRSGKYDVDSIPLSAKPQKLSEDFVVVNDAPSYKTKLILNENTISWIESRDAEYNFEGVTAYRNQWNQWEFNFSEDTLEGEVSLVRVVDSGNLLKETQREIQCNFTYINESGEMTIITDKGERINIGSPGIHPIIFCDDNYLVHQKRTIEEAPGSVTKISVNNLFLYDLKNKENIYSRRVIAEVGGTKSLTWAKIIDDYLYFLQDGDTDVIRMHIPTKKEEIILSEKNLWSLDINDKFLAYIKDVGAYARHLYLLRLSN